jgi:hypothetical protein
VFHQGEEVLRLREQLESQNVEAVQLQVLSVLALLVPPKKKCTILKAAAAAELAVKQC